MTSRDTRGKNSGRPYNPSLTAYDWTGNDSFNLILPKPTTDHKGKDRQAKAYNQKRSINSPENLFNE
jgi:hypothetical protein